MPWSSVPYSNTALRQNLTECFNVRGIPYLVLVDSNGNIITENARAEITDDPDGLVKNSYVFCLFYKKTDQIFCPHVHSTSHGENDSFIHLPRDCYQSFKTVRP